MSSLKFPLEDGDEGDIIICSSDGVKFRMFKYILGKASPHFANMFTLPPIPTNPSTQSNKDDALPVVHVSENSALISKFLCFCHPSSPKPHSQSVYDVLQLYILGDKYMVDALKDYARMEITRFIPQSPIGAFAAAMHAGWKDEAKTAARESLKLTIEEITFAGGKEMEHVSAGTMKILAKYRRSCREAVEIFTTPTFWICHQRDSDFPLERRLQGEVNPVLMETNRDRIAHFQCDNYVTVPLDLELIDTRWGLPSPVFVYDETEFYEVSALHWFNTYLKTVGVALQERPGRRDLYSGLHTTEAMSEAIECATCRPFAFKVLELAGTELMELAAEQLDEIALPASLW